MTDQICSRCRIRTRERKKGRGTNCKSRIIRLKMAQQSPRNNCVNSQEPATTARISHFFLPKRTGDRSNVTKKNATISNVTALNKSVCEELCEWEKPVGLMSEYAIEIDDGDEDKCESNGDGYENHSEKSLSGGASGALTQMAIRSIDCLENKAPTPQHLGNSSKSSSERKPPSTDNYCFGRGGKSKEIKIPSRLEEGIIVDLDDRINASVNAGKSLKNEDGALCTNQFSSFAFALGGAESSFFDLKSPCMKRKDVIPEQERSEQNRLKSSNSSTRAKIQKRELTPEVVPIVDLPLEKRMAICSKWQSFSDPEAELTVRRFQTLVAARLHARAREPVVRAAMHALRTHFASSFSTDKVNIESSGGDRKSSGKSNDGGGLCVDTVAKADPEELASIISSIHFANVKARQIVQAAKEIKLRFKGEVPETNNVLQQITGIGPKLADILSVCNSSSSYSSQQEKGSQF